MKRIIAFAGVVLLVLGSHGQSQTKDDKPPPKKALGKTAEEIVENLLKAMDADMDGKISRKEAKGKLAEDFDKVDMNKDGYLDRKELRVLAERMLANQGKGPGPFGGPFGGPPRPDFDAFDKNADGRLTPDELKGTPYAARFAEIDTDKNGYIDRREFESFLKREAAVKEKTP
jgi:Ca2+-binding EF-hand superfamily protein